MVKLSAMNRERAIDDDKRATLLGVHVVVSQSTNKQTKEEEK